MDPDLDRPSMGFAVYIDAGGEFSVQACADAWYTVWHSRFADVFDAKRPRIYAIYPITGQRWLRDWSRAFAKEPISLRAGWEATRGGGKDGVTEIVFSFSRKVVKGGRVTGWQFAIDVEYHQAPDPSAFVDALQEFGGLVRVSYAEIFPDGLSFGDGSALERALGKRNSGTPLRGYGWATVCSDDCVQFLGGVSHLQASGAFSEIRHMAQGGYLLIAACRSQDYSYEAARRVFDVLRPALPTGTPNTLLAYGAFLVNEDAAAT